MLLYILPPGGKLIFKNIVFGHKVYASYIRPSGDKRRLLYSASVREVYYSEIGCPAGQPLRLYVASGR